MLRSYLAVAFRSFRQERAYTFINVAGLAIGLTICLLVTAYVAHEWSYDSFHSKANRLFKINLLENDAAGINYSCNGPFALRGMILDNIPEAEAAVQVIPMAGVMVSGNGQTIHEMITLADSEFFDVFSFPLRRGEPGRVLAEPTSVVVSSSFAERMFGPGDPVGQELTITWGGKTNDFTVSGVAANAPSNSSLTFQLIIPKAALNRFFKMSESWNTSWPETYLLVRPNADFVAVQAKLNEAAKTVPRAAGSQRDWQFEMQPIRDIHLNPHVLGAMNTNSPTYSYLLCLIGIVVLVLACINFTTLAIGRSQRRVREIGVRKVMGASPKQLIAQILGETLLVALVGMLMAFVLAELFLPHFSALSGKPFQSILPAAGWWLLPAIGLLLAAALLAGGYPALVLSRVKMLESLRGKAALLTSPYMTRALVALQLAVSAALIIITLSMSHQLNFMMDAPLGFDKQQLVMIRLDGTAMERISAVGRLRESLFLSDGVVSVAGSGVDFTGGGVRKSKRVGPDSSEFSVFVNPVDYAYAQTMGLEFTQGGDFASSMRLPGTATDVIVNETLVKILQWDDPIGKEVPLLEPCRVVGVVKDYHIQPFTSYVEPMALVETAPGDDWADNLQFAFVRISPENVPATMNRLAQVWKEIAPDLPFEYEFMDAHIESQYRSYIRWADIMQNAAFLAVVVACFGVFGLTALAITRRRKELGIRKVLGAKSSQLVALLNREFVVLTILGNLVAWPIAYWSVNEWLASFVYRTSLSTWPFVAGMVILLGVVMLTISTQAVRAASTNPAEVIRYE